MDLNTASAPTSSTLAPYGRACLSCAQAKSKCIASHRVGAKCERCHRLNKECQSSPAVRRRRAIKTSSATKTARLEEKLDGLVSLLQSASKSLPMGTSNVATVAQMRFSPESPQALNQDMVKSRAIDSYITHMSDQNVSYSGDDLGLQPPMLTHNPPVALIPAGFELSLTEANDSLRTFRTCKLKHFPFIMLPESVTAEELRRDRPFLWFCIMAVSSRSSVQQTLLAGEIRMIIGRQVLLEGERTVDLLLGLLTYIAWNQSYSNKRPIMSSLIQVAVGLLVDLGLNKPPLKEPPHMMLNYDIRGCPKLFNPSIRTMEEVRAAIACFSSSSVISLYFQRLDPPRWTLYLEDCLRMLAENKEYPTDNLLACLVRLQLITEKITQTPWHDGSADHSGSMKAPPIFYLKAMETQLQEFKRSIPLDLQQNETLLLHLYHTSLSIHEIALSKSLALPCSPDFQRLDSLYACLHATKSWFDLFLTIPPAGYLGFPTAIFTQVPHCVVVLYRLSSFSDEETAWDRSLVRETLDFSKVLDQVVQRVSRTRPEAGLYEDGSEENNIWCGMESRIAAIKSWWDAKMLAESERGNELAMGGDEVVGEFWDENWLDILGLRDYQF